jgi:hypothetical protein
MSGSVVNPLVSTATLSGRWVVSNQPLKEVFWRDGPAVVQTVVFAARHQREPGRPD